MVRALPLDNRALLERVERQARAHLPELERFGADRESRRPRARNHLDPELQHRDGRDEDRGGKHRRKLEHRQLRIRRGARLGAVDDDHVDVGLENALRERLDDHLGDDACRLVGRDELAQPLWKGQDGEQPKGLTEHQAVERQEAPWEAEDEEEEVDRAIRAKRALQVWQHAQLDNEELEHQKEDADAGPSVVASGPEQHRDLHIRDEVRKVEADGEDSVGRAHQYLEQRALHQAADKARRGRRAAGLFCRLFALSVRVAQGFRMRHDCLPDAHQPRLQVLAPGLEPLELLGALLGFRRSWILAVPHLVLDVKLIGLVLRGSQLLLQVLLR